MTGQRTEIELNQIDLIDSDKRQEALNLFTNVSSASIGDTLSKDAN
jgi:hypothetical protein